MVSSIKGDPPNLISPPPGCGFCPRCDEKVAACETEHPDLVEVGPRALRALPAGQEPAR